MYLFVPSFYNDPNSIVHYSMMEMGTFPFHRLFGYQGGELFNDGDGYTPIPLFVWVSRGKAGEAVNVTSGFVERISRLTNHARTVVVIIK